MDPQHLFALARRALKDAVFETPFARFIAPRWQFNYTPSQLGFLCDCLSKVRDVPGPVFEVGCFAGATTVFLHRHLQAEGIDKPYLAVDTVEGFTAADVMTPVVFAVLEETELSRAAALMAVEGIGALPVVMADGSVGGLLTAVDVLRWIARADGFQV